MIDLNADLGEHPHDADPLVALITSANVAGGGHAGGGQLLIDTVALCVQHGIQVGAHPSYPDRDNFGRTSQWGSAPEHQLSTSIQDQIRAVATTLAAHGRTLTHVKAHGALYNDAMTNPRVAALLLDAIAHAAPAGTPVLGQPGSVLAQAATERGIPFIAEGFLDRTYQPDGTLTPRTRDDALITDHDHAIAHIRQIVHDRHVTTTTGQIIPLDVATICVHADTDGAAQLLHAVASDLNNHGVAVTPFIAPPALVPHGDSAHLLLRLPNPTGNIAAIRTAGIRTAASTLHPRVEVRAGLDSILLSWPTPTDTPDTADLHRQLAPALTAPDTTSAHNSTHHTIPVRYDGQDLHELATTLGVAADDLIAAHQAITWTVALIGFAPGFPYLRPDNPDTDAAALLTRIPRRDTPRTHVPAGSVALAAGMSAIYPDTMPGGWNLLGHTDITLFDAADDTRPSLLTAGDTVTFTRDEGTA